MSNNMDLGYEMFCYQCEQTANGKGCTRLGVCGKTPEIANLQDLLIFQLKGISCYGKVLIEKGQHIDKDIVRFVENCLFTTLTNVNFDADMHVSLCVNLSKSRKNFVKLWAKSKIILCTQPIIFPKQSRKCSKTHRLRELCTKSRLTPTSAL